jgi:hypothetical protein
MQRDPSERARNDHVIMQWWAPMKPAKRQIDLDKINEGWAATEENRNEDAFMIDRKTARARRRKSILGALEAMREET